MGNVVIANGKVVMTSTCAPTKAPTPATPTPTLAGTKILTITDDQKNYLTEQHNLWRSKVAKGLVIGFDGKALPKAAKMNTISWDETIAQAAQNWANTCEQKHDPNNGMNVFLQTAL